MLRHIVKGNLLTQYKHNIAEKMQRMDKFMDTFSRRTSDRHKVIFKSRIKIGTIATACEIHDISTGGARIKASFAAAPQAPVTLEIKQLGHYAALIAWAHQSELGIKFDDDPERIALALDLILKYGQR